MPSDVRYFGALPGTGDVECVKLKNGELSCEILSYGATLRSLNVPDAGGRSRDVLLGFDSIEDYARQAGYLGAMVGRVCNRIGGAGFELNGKSYELFKNDGENTLHGGRRGFDKRLWKIESAGEAVLRLSLVSEDGEEGFPGRLEVGVTYELKQDALEISCRAVSDADTLCNLTNHAYFNLNGHGSGSVLGHKLRICASRYTPTDAELIPTGELADVLGTPMDLRELVRIGDRIDMDFEPLKLAGGFDHNYAVDGADGSLRLAAVASSDESGIVMETWTTQPGIQLYTGNGMSGLPKGKDGAEYLPRTAFCLETQLFPDAIHHTDFPSCILRKGGVFRCKTVYAFKTK